MTSSNPRALAPHPSPALRQFRLESVTSSIDVTEANTAQLAHQTCLIAMDKAIKRKTAASACWPRVKTERGSASAVYRDPSPWSCIRFISVPRIPGLPKAVDARLCPVFWRPMEERAFSRRSNHCELPGAPAFTTLMDAQVPTGGESCNARWAMVQNAGPYTVSRRSALAGATFNINFADTTAKPRRKRADVPHEGFHRPSGKRT